MTWLLLWLHIVALAVWLGETVFFAAVVAPALFGGLDRAEAGAVTALIFPGYYVAGYVCGVVLLVTAVALWQRSQQAGGLWLAAAGLAALSLAACLYAGLAVLPEAEALRPQLHDAAAAAAARPRFDALHRVAVQLNAAVLVGTLAIAALVAARLGAGQAPRRSRYGSDPLL